jgi:glycine cleavage system transcriptional repressor
MRHFALSAIGRDRPGIVAAVTERLLEHELNIEDSQMAILRGHFTMVLILAAPDDADEQALRDGLEEVAARLGLEAMSLSGVEHAAGGGEPSHIVTVYGADRPGIVHATAHVLAEHGVNITDLQTRLLGEDAAEPIYAMLLEVALPDELAGEELERLLRETARDQGLEVSVRALEHDAL